MRDDNGHDWAYGYCRRCNISERTADAQRQCAGVPGTASMNSFEETYDPVQAFTTYDSTADSTQTAEATISTDTGASSDSGSSFDSGFSGGESGGGGGGSDF